MLGNPRQSWILDSSFWIFWNLVRGTWIPDFNLWRDSGFFRELNSGSKAQDTGFHKENLVGFRNRFHPVYRASKRTLNTAR